MKQHVEDERQVIPEHKFRAITKEAPNTGSSLDGALGCRQTWTAHCLYMVKGKVVLDKNMPLKQCTTCFCRDCHNRNTVNRVGSVAQFKKIRDSHHDGKLEVERLSNSVLDQLGAALKQDRRCRAKKAQRRAIWLAAEVFSWYWPKKEERSG